MHQQLEKIVVLCLEINTKILGFLYCPVFAAKSAVWEIFKVKNSLIFLERGVKPKYFSKACIEGRSKLE